MSVCQCNLLSKASDLIVIDLATPPVHVHVMVEIGETDRVDAKVFAEFHVELNATALIVASVVVVGIIASCLRRRRQSRRVVVDIEHIDGADFDLALEVRQHLAGSRPEQVVCADCLVRNGLEQLLGVVAVGKHRQPIADSPRLAAQPQRSIQQHVLIE